MAAFDPDRYRKGVLGPVRANGGIQSSNPFELFGLDPNEDDDAVIYEQTEQVVGFWQKERNNPKYRPLVTALLGVRDDLLDQLRDPGRRRLLRSQVLSSRTDRERARFALLDAAVARLVERSGGLPSTKLDHLRLLGRSCGLSDAECDARLRPHRIVQVAGTGARLAPPVRAQIRAALEELGELTGNQPPMSLFDLLGVDIDAPDDEISRQHGELAARNRERRADRLRAVIDELLTHSMSHLVRNDRRLYIQALAEDVADGLRQNVLLAVLVEDELTDEDQAHLVEQAVALGLDSDRARQVVDHLAWEAGDRRWCSSRHSEPGNDEDDRQDPSRSAPADRRPLRQAIADARAALDAGRPAEAAGHAQLAESLGDGPAVSSLHADVQRVLESARRTWGEVEEAIRLLRFVAAQAKLTSLARTAADVPGPTSARGRLPAARLAFASKQVSAALRVLSATDALADPCSAGAEAIVLDALSMCADLPAAMEALSRLPPSPPGNVTAERRKDSVIIRWEASPSPGPVEYKVTREVAGSVRIVGTTAHCSLEDGGASPDSPGVYTVAARRFGCSSPSTPADFSRP